MSPGAVATVADILKPEDFYLETHRHIFETIRKLYVDGTAVDQLTVAADLASQGLLALVGGKEYIHSLVDMVPAAGNAGRYAEIVATLATRRRLVEAGLRIIELGGQSDNLESALDQAEAALYSVRATEGRETSNDLDDLLPDFLDRVNDAINGKKSTGQSTGFMSIDSVIGGFTPGNLILLAARPSIGKSALALNMAERIAANTWVAFFSLEMSRRELLERLACGRAGVPINLLRSASLDHDQKLSLYNESIGLQGLKLHIDDASELNIFQLKSRLRRVATRHTLGLVVVDYIQLMTGGDREGNRNLELADISRGLKQAAREYDVPVLALSQMSRPNKEFASPPPPRLSDLRDSGALEQDADIVLALHRPEHKEEGVPVFNEKERDFYVLKNRQGPISHFYLDYRPEVTTFKDRTR
jgi:replicative DNA helicase